MGSSHPKLRADVLDVLIGLIVECEHAPPTDQDLSHAHSKLATVIDSQDVEQFGIALDAFIAACSPASDASPAAFDDLDLSVMLSARGALEAVREAGGRLELSRYGMLSMDGLAGAMAISLMPGATVTFSQSGILIELHDPHRKKGAGKR